MVPLQTQCGMYGLFYYDIHIISIAVNRARAFALSPQNSGFYFFLFKNYLQKIKIISMQHVLVRTG